MTADKLYKSLTSYAIIAKLTNHSQRTRLKHHRLIRMTTHNRHWTLKMTSAQVVETSVTDNGSFRNYDPTVRNKKSYSQSQVSRSP